MPDARLRAPTAGIRWWLVSDRLRMRACVVDSRSRSRMPGRLQNHKTNVQRRPEPCENPRSLQTIDREIKHCIRAFGLRSLVVATDGEHAFVGSACGAKVLMKGLLFPYGPGLELCRTWWGLPEDIIALPLSWSASPQRLAPTIYGLRA